MGGAENLDLSYIVTRMLRRLPLTQLSSTVFCFGSNAVFAELLRYFGFRVSEVVGRRLMNKDSNPETHPQGWKCVRALARSETKVARDRRG